MKKFLMVIVAGIFLVCFQTAYASGFELTVDSKTADPGQTVDIDLTFSNNPGIIAALFELEYDRERLELIKAEDKALLAGAVFSQTYEQYPYVMLWNSSSSKNFTSDGTLVTLTFKVIDDAKGGNAVINVSSKSGNIFDVNLNDVDIHINDGSIHVLNELDLETENSDKDIADEKVTDEDTADKDIFDEETTDEKNTASKHNGSSVSGVSRPKDTHNTTTNKREESVSDNNTFVGAVSFDDVNKSDWYYSVITNVVERKLMNGISDTNFAPDNLLTRGMLVTILYRNEGEPATDMNSPFADVDGEAYYANAVSWAEYNGIVYGVNDDEFSPDSNITREQIAAIFHRYAKYKGYDTKVGDNTNILSYEDFDKISEYAINAVQYAVGSGLMNGKTESTLNPLDYATRAETAAILCRFTENNI